MPTHAAMIQTALPRLHRRAGAVPSPDGRFLATSGRGSSNVYLIDAVNKKVVGNVPNPLAGPNTHAERLSSGILVGREPHEPTFTRNGKELWVTLRGEDRIAILEVGRAMRQAEGNESGAILRFVNTIDGPAQVWFDAKGALAFVASQKVSKIDVFRVNPDANGYSRPERLTTLDIAAQDKPAFTPFLKTSPDGREVWMSHKLADTVSVRSTADPFGLLDAVPLSNLARPNHVEFVENRKGKVIMQASRAWTITVQAASPQARLPSSTAARRPGRARSRARSSPARARHTASGPIRQTTCVRRARAGRTAGTPNAGQTCAPRSTCPIPSARNS